MLSSGYHGCAGIPKITRYRDTLGAMFWKSASKCVNATHTQSRANCV